MISIDEWIKKLNLKPHPEGGYYTETYRSKETISMEALPHRFGAERSFSTGIYFLIPSGLKTAFHRIKSDEMWHFYYGAPVEVVQLDPTGTLHTFVLGDLNEEKTSFQNVVPAGRWFGARCLADHSYSLVGCTVSPGFDFDDFELGKKEDLLDQFPTHSTLINEFF